MKYIIQIYYIDFVPELFINNTYPLPLQPGKSKQPFLMIF